MIVHRLRVSGFKGIGRQMDLEFPEAGRIGILGANESGKTTLLEAIEYALYGLRRGRSIEEARENIITWGREEAELEIEFSSGQDRFLLSRAFSISGKHKAMMTPVVDGSKDTTKALTSLTEIEAKLVQISGMDRESFTKLVYVKQKDLDALKDLAKTRREQLINKVMGIEVFDDTTTLVKSDLSKANEELDKLEIRLGSVRSNSLAYEERLVQKNLLQDEIDKLKETLASKEGNLAEAEKTLEGYNWLSSFDSASGLVVSLTRQRDRLRQDLDSMRDLTERIDTYQKVLDRYKPEVSNLENLRTSFLNLENHLRQSQSARDSLEAKVNEARVTGSLTDEVHELLKKDLPTKRQRQFRRFVLTLLVCFALILSAVMISPLIILVALLVGTIAGKSYRTYQKIDKILSSNAQVQALNVQIAEEDRRIEETKEEIEGLVEKTRFKGHIEVENALSTINQEIKAATGQTSIQAVEAIKESSGSDLNGLRETKPDARVEEIDNDLRKKSKEIEDLEKSKPESACNLSYDKRQHEDSERKAKELRTDYLKIDGELKEKLGITKQLEVDLERLREDHDLLPVLEEESKRLQDKKRILEYVVQELGETSKELRSKVIPHARLIINQILPTITDGRYSEFDITEDLKFKVHSNEARGYKEREVFSGGTQDQFLIALRLAFTQSILDSRVMADKYFLLMDECISSSDDQRKQGIFDVLEAMKKTFSQIFVIAHEDISNFVDYHIGLAKNRSGYSEIRVKSW